MHSRKSLKEMLKINSSVEMELKYDSLYSGLVSINKSLGGTQSMPDSEYGAMIDLMETLSGQPVGESGDAYDAVSTVATMAENGELPIQGGGTGGNKIDVAELGLKFGYSTFSTVPDVFDFTNMTDMNNMFRSCAYLTAIPQMDTSRVTSMEYTFLDCLKLQSIPLLNTSKVTSMYYTFRGCTSLTTIPQLDTSNVSAVESMFYGCDALESIPLLDFSNVGHVSSILNPSYLDDLVNLTYMGGFKNLKVDFDIQKAPNLTVQSLMNVINNLYDFVGNGSTTTKTLKIGTTNLNKLTDEQKAVATNKGWSLK